VPYGSIVLSLQRLDRVRDVDPVNATLTVEAGCTLKSVQDAAEAADSLFPLSLASEGSCRIGGNLATNAGGTAVLRYGNARELVLGLEVVLADGPIWNGLKACARTTRATTERPVHGSEGTLGIITAAVLKLFPKPRQRCPGLRWALPRPRMRSSCSSACAPSRARRSRPSSTCRASASPSC
jgi:FAD/FMN-containing dehydrogenase